MHLHAYRASTHRAFIYADLQALQRVGWEGLEPSTNALKGCCWRIPAGGVGDKIAPFPHVRMQVKCRRCEVGDCGVPARRTGRVRASEGFRSRSPCLRNLSLPRAFAALAEGGQVQMPLTKTFWSARFGMLIDRFGIGWMVSVTA